MGTISLLISLFRSLSYVIVQKKKEKKGATSPCDAQSLSQLYGKRVPLTLTPGTLRVGACSCYHRLHCYLTSH